MFHVSPWLSPWFGSLSSPRSTMTKVRPGVHSAPVFLQPRFPTMPPLSFTPCFSVSSLVTSRSSQSSQHSTHTHSIPCHQHIAAVPQHTRPHPRRPCHSLPHPRTPGLQPSLQMDRRAAPSLCSGCAPAWTAPWLLPNSHSPCTASVRSQFPGSCSGMPRPPRHTPPKPHGDACAAR